MQSYHVSYEQGLQELDQQFEQMIEEDVYIPTFTIPTSASPKDYIAYLRDVVKEFYDAHKDSDRIKKIIQNFLFKFTGIVRAKLYDELMEFKELLSKINPPSSPNPFQSQDTWLITTITQKYEAIFRIDEHQEYTDDIHDQFLSFLYRRLTIAQLLFQFRELINTKIGHLDGLNAEYNTQPIETAKRELLIKSIIVFSQLLNDLENGRSVNARLLEISLLESTLSNTIDVIENPLSTEARANLQQNANEIRGNPSALKLVLGAVLCVAGAVMMALSFAGIVHSGGLSVGGIYFSKYVIGAGYGLISASGFALFASGRRKSLSKAAQTVIDEAQQYEAWQFAQYGNIS